MANDDYESREEGVDFEDVDLESLDYPVDNDEVIDRLGDQEVSFTMGGTRTIAELLEGLDTTYESPEGLRQMALTMVDDEAVGRTEYSDSRGTAPEGEATENEQREEREGEDRDRSF